MLCCWITDMWVSTNNHWNYLLNTILFYSNDVSVVFVKKPTYCPWLDWRIYRHGSTNQIALRPGQVTCKVEQLTNEQLFHITTDWLRDQFSKSLKSGEFSGRDVQGLTIVDNTLIVMYIFHPPHNSPRVNLPLDDVYYRTAAYTLCRVHSGISLYKSAQTIHKSVNQQQHKLISPKRGRWSWLPTIERK